MSDRLGFVFYGEDDMNPNAWRFRDTREYSEDTAKSSTKEIKKMIDGLYDETRKILEANRDLLDALAKRSGIRNARHNDVDRIIAATISQAHGRPNCWKKNPPRRVRYPPEEDRASDLAAGALHRRMIKILMNLPNRTARSPGFLFAGPAFDTASGPCALMIRP